MFLAEMTEVRLVEEPVAVFEAVMVAERVEAVVTAEAVVTVGEAMAAVAATEAVVTVGEAMAAVAATAVEAEKVAVAATAAEARGKVVGLEGEGGTRTPGHQSTCPPARLPLPVPPPPLLGPDLTHATPSAAASCSALCHRGWRLSPNLLGPSKS